MHDIFEEYGSLIIAIISAVILIGGGALLLKTGSFAEWIAQYVESIGG